jgi:putative lipoic acid-binding regulatory protein
MYEPLLPELLFPCEYPVKVIGRDEDNFYDFVLDLVTRHVPELTPDDFSTRRSGGGKYLSVSVSFIAQSRAQVDGLYRELGQHSRVIVAL